MKRNKTRLDRARVTQSCGADWDSMSGDNRARFCDHCTKKVYNLSSMTRSQAEALLQNTAGQICIRFERLEDGTILTQNDFSAFHKTRLRPPRISSAAMTAILGVNLYVAANPVSINKPLATHWQSQRKNKSKESQDKGGRSSIVGTVFEFGPYQAVIGKAKVTVTRKGTKFKQSIYSSDEGTFQFQALMSGIYTLTVEADNFIEVRKSNLSLRHDKQLIQDITLVPDRGRITEVIMGIYIDEKIEPSKIPDRLLEPLSEPTKTKKPKA